MNDVDQLVRENLHRLRVQRGLTQQALAARMQALGYPFHQSTVHKIESGLRKVYLADACALAQVLRVDLGQLLHARAV